MEVKKAVETAKKELISLLGEEEVSDVRLEEIDKDVINPQWQITFSYLPKETDPIISLAQQRIYKKIVVDDDGNFVSMKIRELAKA